MKVVRSGIILAFVSYPAAMLEMSVSPLWSFLFFLMLLNLSLGTIAGALEMLVAFVLEEFPALQKHRLYVLLAMAAGCFLVGLPLSCEGGIHLFTLLDSRGTVSTLLITLGQCIAISWVYGIRNFLEDIKELNVWLMNGYFWGFLWTVVSPGAIIYVYVYSLVDLEPIGYGAYEYPDYIQSVGLFLMLLPILLFSGYAVYFCAKAARAGLSWREFYSHAVKPTDNWWRLRRQKFVVQNEHHGIDSDFKTVHHAHAL